MRMNIEAPCSKLQRMFCPTAVLRADCKEVYYFKIRSLTFIRLWRTAAPLGGISAPLRQAAGNALAIAVQKSIWLFIILGLFIPCQLAYADKCDDIFAEAKGISEAARKAAKQKNYERAAELYEEAAEHYDEVANIPKCRCPKIHRASLEAAKSCTENAEYYEEYANEARLYDEFNRAKGIYNKGNTYARKRQWDEAVTAFEEAARIWESIGAATQSENGKSAIKAAKQARAAASLALERQQSE
jgi:tetratricopeptide (TPR) repeat protein